MTTGVLLMTYGAPQDEADVPRYLAAVRGGRAATDDLVAEMRRRYRLIGGSPLVRITKEQARALERELGDGYAVAAGMRFSQPSIAEAASEVVRRGAERVIGVVLSPQWSPILMGGYVRALGDAASPLPWAASEAWHRDSLFIEALAERLTEGLADADPDAAVLLTAHSLPQRVFDAEPGYVAQLRETAELVAARAGLVDGKWRWAYQSAGHTAEEWLRPDLKELFPALAEEGRREILVAPVQFLSDHLEVLYDLDIAAAEEARASGLRYRRIAMPNTGATFIRALASVARATESMISVAA